MNQGCWSEPWFGTTSMMILIPSACASVISFSASARLPPSSSWGTRTQTLSVQGSTDGSSFPTIAAPAGYTFNPSTGSTVTITFPSTTARYVRLTFTANTGWPAGQVSEFQVWTS